MIGFIGNNKQKPMIIIDRQCRIFQRITEIALTILAFLYMINKKQCEEAGLKMND